MHVRLVQSPTSCSIVRWAECRIVVAVLVGRCRVSCNQLCEGSLSECERKPGKHRLPCFSRVPELCSKRKHKVRRRVLSFAQGLGRGIDKMRRHFLQMKYAYCKQCQFICRNSRCLMLRGLFSKITASNRVSRCIHVSLLQPQVLRDACYKVFYRVTCFFISQHRRARSGCAASL